MGGEVGVDSEQGHGSRFWVTLPVATLRTQRGPNPLGAGKRILVVDDLRVCREGLATKLNLFSFEAVAVSSVDEAWQRLSSGEAFDLVIADELMPGKGGLDLLDEHARRSPHRTPALRAALAVRLRSCRGGRPALPAGCDRPKTHPCAEAREAPRQGALGRHAALGERRRRGPGGGAVARPSHPPGRGPSRQSARRAAAAAENGRGGDHRQQRRRGPRAARRGSPSSMRCSWTVRCR